MRPGRRSTCPGWRRPTSIPPPGWSRPAAIPTCGWLERLENPKTGVLARNITVDQVRGLAELFDLTPSMSPWRAVVIDAADDLEKSAANALLKMLEEPPANCVFLLVSHAPGRLLPTIRSRCRLLSFSTAWR